MVVGAGVEQSATIGGVLPEIVYGSEIVGGKWLSFTVRDSGPGWEKALAGRAAVSAGAAGFPAKVGDVLRLTPLRRIMSFVARFAPVTVATMLWHPENDCVLNVTP